jgi:hypothetical protein
MAHANPKNRKKNLNASFVSNVERFRNSECEQPPVGQYELNYYNIDKGPKRANNVRFFLVIVRRLGSITRSAGGKARIKL